MNVLLLLDDAIATDVVARMLYLDMRTVEEYRRLYKEQCAAGMGAFGYRGRASGKISFAQIDALKQHICGKICATSQAACAYVKAAFGHDYTTNAMTKLLRRIGLSYK